LWWQQPLVTPSVHAVAQPRAIDQAVQTIRTLRIHLGNSKAAWPIVMAQLTGDSASFPCVHGGSIMQGRPVLTKWLAGAHAAHPLLRPEMPDWFLDTLELIVAPVDAAEPLRLPTKMKAFRTLTTDAELLEQRAELLIGSMIARSGVPFEFGKDHPDYVLGEQALGIEVGSRALDGPWGPGRFTIAWKSCSRKARATCRCNCHSTIGRSSSAPLASRRSPKQSPPTR
jgi:hypothetical protein